MGKSANHHVVPQFLLNAFSVDGDKIFYFSKRRVNEGVSLRKTSRKFYRRHYYSTKSSLTEYDDRIERSFFQVLDSRFSQLAKDIVSGLSVGSLTKLTASDALLVKWYMYFQKKRSPDFLDPMIIELAEGTMISEALARFESIYGEIEDDEKARLMSEAVQKDILHSVRVEQSVTASPEVWDRLVSMDILFAIAPERSQFIIGSNPVIRFENQPNAYLGDGAVELWMPLSPRVVVGLVGPHDRKGPMAINLRKDQVRKINEQILLNSDEVGSASERLLISLVRSKTLISHRH